MRSLQRRPGRSLAILTGPQLLARHALSAPRESHSIAGQAGERYPMMRYDRRTIGLAVGLTCLAGYVDALGFISLGGFFVSFMTGNTTRLGIELANGHLGGIALAGGIIMLFAGGVVLGSLVGHFARTRRHTAVLAALTICLFIAALSDRLGEAGISIAMLAVAMGMENSVFQRDGEVTIGLTYMTGTLVKMGQRIAGALLGGSRLA